MRQLTYKNHFKFGYNGEWFSFRKAPSDKWTVKYGRAEREAGTLKEECIHAAKLIQQEGIPITILLSGGCDSEFAVRCFKEADVPISCATVAFKQNLNRHDIEYAIDICRQLNIKHKILELNIFDFWLGDLWVYATKTYCVSPQLPVIMWLSDQIEGYIIIGSGECYLTNKMGEWEMFEREKVAAWYRHFLLTDKPGAPGFFQYTPELILSFLRDPVVQDLVQNKLGFEESLPIKSRVYEKFYEIRKREKYTGFEKIISVDDLQRKKLLRLFPHCNEIARTKVSDLFDRLSPVQIKEVAIEEISKHEQDFNSEKMTLTRTPFDKELIERRFFKAYVNGKLAGITAFDILQGNRVYQHAAFTFSDFRGTGVNNDLWKHKMKEIRKVLPDDAEVLSINPDWIPGAKIMEEKLKRIGFTYGTPRPDGAKVLRAVLGDLHE